MFSMIPIFSAKILKAHISPHRSSKNTSVSIPGFTLLELIISMTIVSMVVLVLYYAFSIGVRTWDSQDDAEQEVMRLEAVIRLVEEDFRQIVPYNMIWEKGEISLFAGGGQSVFYVTENGLGSVSGAGAGLFFAGLYLDQCPDDPDKCLFLIKKPYPSMAFVDQVNFFKGLGEFQRRDYIPGTQITEDKILLVEGLSEARFSFSSRQYIPFGGISHDLPDDHRTRDGQLEEDHWVRKELPSQIRFEFVLQDKRWVVHLPLELLK